MSTGPREIGTAHPTRSGLRLAVVTEEQRTVSFGGGGSSQGSATVRTRRFAVALGASTVLALVVMSALGLSALAQNLGAITGSLAAVTAATLANARRRQAGDGTARIAWTSATIGLCATGLYGLALAVSAMAGAGGPAGFGAMALRSALYGAPALIGAGWLSFGRTRPRVETRRFCEALLLGGGLFLLAWGSIIGPVASRALASGSPSALVRYATPGIALGVLVAVLIRVTSAERGLSKDLVAAMLGLGLFSVADLAQWTASSVSVGTRVPLLSFGEILGAGLVAFAAEAPARRDRRSGGALGRERLVPPVLAAAGLGAIAIRDLLGHTVFGPAPLAGVAAVAIGALALAASARPWPHLVVTEGHAGEEDNRGSVAELGQKRRISTASSGLSAVVDHFPDLVLVIEPDLTIRFVSEAADEILGCGVEDLVGRRLDELEGPGPAALVDALARATINPSQRVSWSLEPTVRSRGRRIVESTIANLLDEPEVGAFIVSTRDVTERADLEEELRQRAFQDPVTGLTNRVLFVDRAEQALDRRLRSGGEIAILVAGIERIGSDASGSAPELGDELLRAAAGRLGVAMPSECTVARISGGEFAVLVDSIGDGTGLSGLADRIADVLRRPFVISGADHYLSASIGIATSAEIATIEELLVEARTAMSAAKATEGRSARLLASIQGGDGGDRLELEADLRRALENNEFELRYQPAFDVASGELRGFEALLRWMRPGHGTLGPEQFLSLADETGMLLHLGRWVLCETLDQLKVFDEVAAEPGQLTVSVNVSARELHDPQLVTDIAAALEQTGIEPHRLTLEITERAFSERINHALDACTRIRGLGVRLALDNFGTGPASLSLLERLPIDILKIDRSFVRSAVDERGRALLAATIQVAKNLSLHTVGEGAEEPAHLQTLCDLGCDNVQGYLLSRPITASEAVAIVRRPENDVAKVQPILAEWLRRRAPVETELVAT